MSLDSHKLLDVDSEGYICCPVHVIISYTPPPPICYMNSIRNYWGEGSNHVNMMVSARRLNCVVYQSISHSTNVVLMLVITSLIED